MAVGKSDNDEPESWSDEELIAELREIDNDLSIEVSDWEARFLDTVLEQTTLTAKQREKAIEIINEYT